MTKEVRKAYENETRSMDGNPGPRYWQNSSVYNINARFDPDSVKIHGKEIIEYLNNSPDTLDRIRFSLKQNLFNKGNMRDFPVSEQNITDGVKINYVIFEGDTIAPDPHPLLQVTTLKQVKLDSTHLFLPQTTATIEIEWSLSLPHQYEVRTGRSGDSSFFIGYWFPQIVVYDDIHGWDYLFYTGIQETYNDVSNFDVKLEVPGGYLVWATGELQNPGDIYVEEFSEKVEASKHTEDVVHLITEEDLQGNNILQDKTSHIWYFKAENVTDFAFAVSNNSVWDATSVVTDTIQNSRTWVNVVYHPKVDDKTILETAKQSVLFFSTDLPGIPFPFQKHTTFLIQDSPGGMEFPMMAVNGYVPDSLWMLNVTAHEIAHSYMPFLVVTNEERYAWMKAGLPT